MRECNHITREIRNLGECPGCDEYHNSIMRKAYESLKKQNEILVEALTRIDNTTDCRFALEVYDETMDKIKEIK